MKAASEAVILEALATAATALSGPFVVVVIEAASDEEAGEGELLASAAASPLDWPLARPKFTWLAGLEFVLIGDSRFSSPSCWCCAWDWDCWCWRCWCCWWFAMAVAAAAAATAACRAEKMEFWRSLAAGEPEPEAEAASDWKGLSCWLVELAAAAAAAAASSCW